MNPESTSRTAGRLELACAGGLAAVFACFTWRGLTMFFSDDDVMNMYNAWAQPALRIWKALLLPWMPLDRPLGTAVYRVSYAIFGFHALPLYFFGWLLLIGNVFIAWRFYRVLLPSVFTALLALSLTLVHGRFQDLYLSAGTVYDKLCFTFMALAVIVYADARRLENGLSANRVALICFICLMAMNSKETGAVTPAVLFGYECIYCFPAVWRERRARSWVRQIAPLHALLAGILTAFIAGRLGRTADQVTNPAYMPHFSAVHWLSRVSEYMSVLVYQEVHFDSRIAGVMLAAMPALAALLRNRAMLFGWLYFVLTITPVALISSRPGYVLYVPEPGLGLYFAALIGLAAQTLLRRSGATMPGALRPAHAAAIAVVMAFTAWVHARHWPDPPDVRSSSEWRLTEKMRRDYPVLQPGAKILFVHDFPTANDYDAMFNLRLLYGDPSLEVAKLNSSVELRPARTRVQDFNLVFTTDQDTYAELDNRDIEESIRLNVLRDYTPGRHFDSSREDGAGYVVSGITALGRRGWWTAKTAKLKFDIYPADSKLSLEFWVPDFVASGNARNLSVIVDGNNVGTETLSHAGMNEFSFAVPAPAVNASGFTILELSVDDPWVRDGQEYGVVLLRADFDYARK